MDVQYKLYCDFEEAFIAAHPDLKADAALKLAQEKVEWCQEEHR
jgi:hypothetical protein